MEKEQLITLVEKSQSGDTKAVEKLLQYAHTSVSYQCRKMLSNPQDAEDMTQEVLFTIYTKLDTLQEPAAFHRWADQITVSRCINALNRTHVEYQFAEDEEGHSILDTLEELDEQVIPDKAIDHAETVRMIEEIVGNLPDVQRAATLMFYYDEMSVKEIAAAMNVPENTVKSRLNYARKAIKEKVLDYEKQGVKLYGLSPLPFLLYFLRLAAKNSADEEAAGVMVAEILATEGAAIGLAVGAGSVAAAAAGSAAAAVAATTTANGLFAGITAKVVAGVLATIVTVGGVVTLVVPNLQGKASEPSAVSTEATSAMETESSTTGTSTEPAASETTEPTVPAGSSENTEYATCSACGTGQIIPVNLTQDPCAVRLEVAFQCNHCGIIAGYSYPSGKGHTYGLTEDGQYEICTVCGEVLGPANIGHGGVTDDTGHTHSYESVVTTPTCTSAGYTTYTCDCGYSYTGNETAAQGHDWKLAVYNEPLCKMNGSYYYHCTVCPEDYSEMIPALEHNMTDWYILHEPTTDQDGMEMRKCLNKGCDNVQTRTVPKLSA